MRAGNCSATCSCCRENCSSTAFATCCWCRASLLAGIASLVTGSGGQPGRQFYSLLEFGKQTERWINLFGALRHAPGSPNRGARMPAGEFDDLVERLEGFVVDEVRRGGVTARAKERLDRILDAMQRGGSAD